MTKPLVSVFIPYYNDKLFLKQTIDSVLAQTYQNFELILFNHSSTDGSQTVARHYKDKRIIHIDVEENLGAGSGLNLKTSLKYFHGQYIKLLCADDVMKPNCLEKMVSYLEDNPQKDLVFSNMDLVDMQGNSFNLNWWQYKEKIFEETLVPLPPKTSEKELLKLFFIRHSPLPFPAGLFKRKDLEDIDIYVASIMLFDVSLWVSFLVQGKKIGFLEDSLITYRIHSDQLSSLKQEKLCNRRSLYEVSAVYNIFYSIKDIEVCKYLCPESPFIKNLQDGDVEFIPFIIAHYFLTSLTEHSRFVAFHLVISIVGFQKMYLLLSNDADREKIKNRFGFTIADFRKIYSTLKQDEYKEIIAKLNFKQKVYLTPVKNLSFLPLFYLLFRRIYFSVSLRKYHQIRKKKKEDKNKFVV